MLCLLAAATASGQVSAPKASNQPAALDMAVELHRCATPVASPTPQGVQQIHVCNNWTGLAGANTELFNTTGQACTITQGTTAWPFTQNAPLSIPNQQSLFVTLISTLQSGGTYNYYVSCCPQPSAPHTVDVG